MWASAAAWIWMSSLPRIASHISTGRAAAWFLDSNMVPYCGRDPRHPKCLLWSSERWMLILSSSLSLEDSRATGGSAGHSGWPGPSHGPRHVLLQLRPRNQHGSRWQHGSLWSVWPWWQHDAWAPIWPSVSAHILGICTAFSGDRSH